MFVIAREVAELAEHCCAPNQARSSSVGLSVAVAMKGNTASSWRLPNTFLDHVGLWRLAYWHIKF